MVYSTLCTTPVRPHCNASHVPLFDVFTFFFNRPSVTGLYRSIALPVDYHSWALREAGVRFCFLDFANLSRLGVALEYDEYDDNDDYEYTGYYADDECHLLGGVAVQAVHEVGLLLLRLEHLRLGVVQSVVVQVREAVVRGVVWEVLLQFGGRSASPVVSPTVVAVVATAIEGALCGGGRRLIVCLRTAATADTTADVSTSAVALSR